MRMFLVFRVKLGLSLQIITFQEASPCPQAGPSLSSVLEWEGWEGGIDTGEKSNVEMKLAILCVLYICICDLGCLCQYLYHFISAQAEAESSPPLLAPGWLRTGRNKNPINFQSDSDEWIQRPGSQSKPAANLTAEQVCCEAQGPPLIIQNFTGYFEVSART